MVLMKLLICILDTIFDIPLVSYHSVLLLCMHDYLLESDTHTYSQLRFNGCVVLTAQQFHAPANTLWFGGGRFRAMSCC